MATKTEPGSCIIADSSGIISLVNQEDSNHDVAIAFLKNVEKDTLSLLPWDILVETINFIGKRGGHREAVRIADFLLDTAVFALIDTPDNSRNDAFERFSKVPQSVSFTDCIVMAIADQYKTRQIFGFDEAFARNGYQTISKSK